MRIFKSLLVSLIGICALMYGLQNLASAGDIRRYMDAAPSGAGPAAFPPAIFSNSPAASWGAFVLVTLCQFLIAAVALKGAWDLFAARKGSADEFREAKTTAVWVGGLSLFSWFALALMVGGGLFHWGTDMGAVALTRSFQLGSTSALTILFVWGTRD